MNLVLRRAGSIRVFFVVVLALVGMAASAHADSGQGPREARVASALFTPTRVDDGLEWRVRWVLTPEASDDLAQGATRALRFAHPLTDAETLKPTCGVVPFTEAGHVAGVLVDRTGVDDRLVTAVVHQYVAREGARGFRIGAPIAAGSALQIIDADLSAAARLDVDPGRVLERRVGYVAPSGVSHAARAEARRLTGYDGGVRGSAIYVRGDDVTSASGLSAAIVTSQERSKSGTIGLLVVFGAIVLALFAAVKRLRHAASVERADAILAAELDALGPTGQGSR